jgi:hypothetical protein
MECQGRHATGAEMIAIASTPDENNCPTQDGASTDTTNEDTSPIQYRGRFAKKVRALDAN